MTTSPLDQAPKAIEDMVPRRQLGTVSFVPESSYYVISNQEELPIFYGCTWIGEVDATVEVHYDYEINVYDDVDFLEAVLEAESYVLEELATKLGIVDGDACTADRRHLSNFTSSTRVVLIGSNPGDSPDDEAGACENPSDSTGVASERTSVCKPMKGVMKAAMIGPDETFVQTNIKAIVRDAMQDISIDSIDGMHFIGVRQDPTIDPRDNLGGRGGLGLPSGGPNQLVGMETQEGPSGGFTAYGVLFVTTLCVGTLLIASLFAWRRRRNRRFRELNELDDLSSQEDQSSKAGRKTSEKASDIEEPVDLDGACRFEEAIPVDVTAPLDTTDELDDPDEDHYVVRRFPTMWLSNIQMREESSEFDDSSATDSWAQSIPGSSHVEMLLDEQFSEI